MFSEPAILILGGASTNGEVDLLNLSGTNGSLCGESIPDLPHYVRYNGHAITVTSTGTIIECGGNTPGTSYSQLCYYLGDDQEWHLAPVLPYGSNTAVMVSLDNYIVHLGGYHSSSTYDSYIYILEESLNGSWSYAGQMMNKRSRACAVTIESGVIIIG